MGYRLNQEVVLRDGTSLVGHITDGMLNDVDGELKPHYKVAVEGSTGRWYSEDELAPVATPAAAVDSGADGTRPKLGDALEAFRNIDANELFKKAYQSGEYNDMRVAMFALQAENAQLRAALAADDPSGYSELLDELSGQIKRLERALANILKWVDVETVERKDIRTLQTYTEIVFKITIEPRSRTGGYGILGEDDLANALYQAAQKSATD